MTWWQWVLVIGGGWTATSFVAAGLFSVAANRWKRIQAAEDDWPGPDITGTVASLATVPQEPDSAARQHTPSAA